MRLSLCLATAVLASHAVYAQTTCPGLTYADDFQNGDSAWQSTISEGDASTNNPSHALVGPSGLTLNAGPSGGSWLENPSFSQTYGVFQATVNVSSGMLASRMTSAVWLLADHIAPGSKQGWPAEIDFWETASDVADVAMHSGFTPNNAGAWHYGISPGQHTVTVDWEPSEITWYLDGQWFQQAPTPPDFNTPMHFILDAMNQGGSASGSMTVLRVRAFDNMQDAKACDSKQVSYTPNTSGPTVQQSQDALQATNSLSVEDVARLAAQGLTGDGQTAIGVTIGSFEPLILSSNAPSGTMPAPAPATTSVSIDGSGADQTITASQGNGSGIVSGTGNTVTAVGGVVNLDITGIGNTITTGPYDDSVTVESTGNVIDLGGGSNTITLAYKARPAAELMAVSATQIDQDVRGFAPLTPAGNIFVAPQPGMGVLTIKGTMDSKDTIDLTKALAGVAGWDHNPADIKQFITVGSSPTGTQVGVLGRPVVVLGAGTKGNILQHLTAN